MRGHFSQDDVDNFETADASLSASTQYQLKNVELY